MDLPNLKSTISIPRPIADSAAASIKSTIAYIWPFGSEIATETKIKEIVIPRYINSILNIVTKKFLKLKIIPESPIKKIRYDRAKNSVHGIPLNDIIVSEPRYTSSNCTNIGAGAACKNIFVWSFFICIFVVGFKFFIFVSF